MNSTKPTNPRTEAFRQVFRRLPPERQDRLIAIMEGMVRENAQAVEPASAGEQGEL